MTQAPHVIDRRGCIWLLQQRYVTLKRYLKTFFSLRQSSFQFLSTCSPQSPFSLSVFYLLFRPHFTFAASIFHSDPVSVFGLTNNPALYRSMVTNIFHPFFLFVCISRCYMGSHSLPPPSSLFQCLFKRFDSPRNMPTPFPQLSLKCFVFVSIGLWTSIHVFPHPSSLFFPAFLDIWRFSVREHTAPLMPGAFFDLRQSRQLKPMRRQKKEYIFALRLSQRRVIVKWKEDLLRQLAINRKDGCPHWAI